MTRLLSSHLLILHLLLLNSLQSNAQELDKVFGNNKSECQKNRLAGISWPTFQSDAQHTGNNETSDIALPLQLKWYRDDFALPLNAVSVAEDRVLVTFARRWFGALSSQDGTEEYVWYLGDIFDVNQPSYDNGKVFVQANNSTSSFIAAFDLVSGDNLWTAPYRAQWFTMLAPTIHNGVVLFGAGVYGGIQANNAETGELMWWRPGYIWEGWTPAAYQEQVYLWLGGRLRVNDLYTGDTLWSILVTAQKEEGERSLNWWGVSPVIDTINSLAYCMLHKDFYVVDLSTRQLIWSDTGDFGGGINPSIIDSTVFAIRNGGLIAYNGLRGDSLWSFFGSREFIYPPIIANGYVFVSSLKETHAVGIFSRQSEWSYPAGGFLTIAGNSLYIADSSGELYAFGDIATDIEEDYPIIIPSDFTLLQNYPNPFNPNTIVEFGIPIRSHVKISIHNVLGQLVTILLDANLPPGKHSVHWKGKDSNNRECPSGVYFYKITAGEFVDSKKMVLLR